MEIRQLRTFCAIAELESFTRAAHRLGVSQSGISQQISALERELGSKLLSRSGTGARPTAAGTILLHYANSIIQKLDEAERALTGIDASRSGRLRIGVCGAASHYLLPAILRDLHEQFPKCEVRIETGYTAQTVDRLHAADLDVGIVPLPVATQHLRVTALGSDELVAIVGAEHPWNERARVEPSDFADQQLLLYQRRGHTYALIEKVLLESGAFPRAVVEIDHLEAVVALVATGLGVAIVPRWTVPQHNGRLRTIPFVKAGVRRNWAILSRDDGSHPPMLKAFIRLCAERLPAQLACSTS